MIKSWQALRKGMLDDTFSRESSNRGDSEAPKDTSLNTHIMKSTSRFIFNYYS